MLHLTVKRLKIVPGHREGRIIRQFLHSHDIYPSQHRGGNRKTKHPAPIVGGEGLQHRQILLFV